MKSFESNKKWFGSQKQEAIEKKPVAWGEEREEKEKRKRGLGGE